MPGVLGSLSRVVSGGGFALTGPGGRPRNPAVPARVSPPSNCRRLQRTVCWLLIGTSCLPRHFCEHVKSSSPLRENGGSKGYGSLLLHLLLQLLEEVLVSALDNDLLWTVLKHTHFVQAQDIEA